MEYLKFSFSLPVYNEAQRLKRCLDSIKEQDYPKEKIEVLLVDGGSSDETVKIASQYEFVKVLFNPKRLADFGAKISAKEASGELLVIFAADNDLVGKDWLRTVNQIFLLDKEISTLWCRMISSDFDSSINKYYELVQNDPLSFCINKNSRYYQKKALKKVINNKDCYIFEVEKDRPLIWGANGLVYRTSLVKDIILKEGFLGDNDVFQELIEQGNNKVVYFTNLLVVHHHVQSLRQWIRKWKRNYLSHFLAQRKTRNLGWVMDKNFKLKLIFWVVYSILPVFSLVHSLYLLLRDKNIFWLYHPIVSFFQAITYSYLTLTTLEGRNMIKDLLKGKSL
ncbi:MAG: glycosyltransferase [Candidatus Omnitrophica bacterium]|jgi:glycosyltransferase involved in cell wall biosynthesis|nr:glycosyltransferase [Candidatus Omnitrophota bacterium]